MLALKTRNGSHFGALEALGLKSQDTQVPISNSMGQTRTHSLAHRTPGKNKPSEEQPRCKFRKGVQTPVPVLNSFVDVGLVFFILAAQVLDIEGAESRKQLVLVPVSPYRPVLEGFRFWGF